MATGRDLGLVLIEDTYEQVARSMSAAIAASQAAAIQATSQQAIAIADVFSRDVAASERKAFFEKLGDRAHDAVVQSYRRRQRGPSGYRRDASGKMRRYAGGQMLKALENPGNIYEASAKGIVFLPDVDQLDREARQWYRLNFGARPGFGTGSKRFDVSISNVHLFSIGFEGPPSEPFRIPRGFWIQGGQAVEAGAPGSSAFYPAKAAKSELGLNRGRTKAEQKENNFFPGRRQARGITAEHFLDAGLARFVTDLSDPGEEGIGLRGLYYKFYRRGLANVKPTRPPVIHVGTSRLRF